MFQRSRILAPLLRACALGIVVALGSACCDLFTAPTVASQAASAVQTISTGQ